MEINKHKLIIGTEILLLILIVFAFFMAAPVVAQSQDNGSGFSLTSFGDFYKESLVSAYDKSASAIKDPQIAGFYKKYVSSMELDKTGAVSEDQPASLANLLPDIQKINKAALTVPLKEAGTQIQDKELAEFYAGFLKKCGVE